MAGAGAGAAVSFVVEKLGNLLVQEGALLYGVRDQIDWLRTELRWMECFLADADSARRSGDERVKNWVREVRDLAYRAEDIIDLFTLRIDSPRFALLPSALIARRKVSADIQSLRSRIDQISATKTTYGLGDLGAETSRARDRDRDDASFHALRRTSPHLDDDDAAVVGSDAHAKAILERLLDPGVSRRCVVSIVGAGGIGKTTLAKKVFNCGEIRKRFGTCAWVTASQDTAMDILKSVSRKLMGAARDEDDPREELHNFLKRRSYLIVLDDVWRTDVWDQIKSALPDANNGSRVMLTTRSTEVARRTDPGITPYQLPFLDCRQSWELFLRKVFPFPKTNHKAEAEPPACPEELEGIGRHLARRCDGLPLALVVLGGLLSSKDPSPVKWAQVSDQMDWASTPDGEQCMNILAMSYQDLPHSHLRSCFLYLGCFPEDTEIKATEAIVLWVAEGFIQVSAKQMLEDTAQDYLEELAQRSMVQVISRNCDGNVKLFLLHDLVREMCLRQAREDGFLNVHSDSSNPTTRRLAIHNVSDMRGCRPASNLRSLLVFKSKITSEIFYTLKLLRVIRLEGEESLTKLPEEITSMIHLRFLGLCGCWGLTELPSSIGNLCNLQTLDVSYTSISRLPKALGKINALRHIYLPDCCKCVGIGNLTNLQTLDVASARGGWIKRDLAKLSSIRVLGLSGLTIAQGNAFRDSLGELKSLSSLYLMCGELIMSDVITALSNHNSFRHLSLNGKLSQPLPDHRAFPPNLTALILEGSELEQDPMPTLEKLPNLLFLRLSYDSYVGKEMNCTAGGFPRLRHLKLCFVAYLESWSVEVGAMPNLAILFILRCKSLTMLPEGLQHMTSLQELEVHDKRKGFRARLRENVGEDWYKIRHVPSIKVTHF